MAHHQHDHDRGLAFDLETLVSRRGALRLLAGAGLVTLVGCGSGSNAGTTAAAGTSGAEGASSSAASSDAESTSATSTAAACETIPEETAGPFPDDGSNGPNVLTDADIVRSDIRSSFGASRTTAKGVPLTVRLTLRDSANGYKVIKGAAVYLWHCDIDGQYSMYSQNVSEENYLRGVQASDANGQLRFTTIFPAAYNGRWPHIHFEVYPSLTDATAVSSKLRTSQLALPEDTSTLVYATDGCSQSAQHGAVLAGERQRIQRRVFPAARHGDRRRRHRLVAALNVPV